MPNRSNHVLDIYVWDVEHGSAAYLNAGQKNIIIDCGSRHDWSPLRWINGSRFGVNAIDYLIISHPHFDHIRDLPVMDELDIAPTILRRPNSAAPLLEEALEEEGEEAPEEYIEAAEYYLNVLDPYDGEVDVSPSDPSWALSGQNLDNYRTDGGLPSQGVTFHNYQPTNSPLGDNFFEKLNNLSIVTVVNSFGFQLVSMGDLLPEGINKLKQNSSAMAAIKNSEVLIAPHHGRTSSFDSKLVEHINPNLVIFSDEGDPENPATSQYGAIAKGKNVENETTGNSVKRSVVTTRNDGRIRLQASNPDNWEVSVSGVDYAALKANTKRYERLI